MGSAIQGQASENARSPIGSSLFLSEIGIEWSRRANSPVLESLTSGQYG